VPFGGHVVDRRLGQRPAAGSPRARCYPEPSEGK
jgi:hypothetical protein